MIHKITFVFARTTMSNNATKRQKIIQASEESLASPEEKAQGPTKPKLCLDESEYKEAWETLSALLQSYEKNAIDRDSRRNAKCEAFNMLVVLANKREAMLYQGLGDGRDDEPQRSKDQALLDSFADEIQDAIDTKFKLCNRNTLSLLKDISR